MSLYTVPVGPTIATFHLIFGWTSFWPHPSTVHKASALASTEHGNPGSWLRKMKFFYGISGTLH
jgi:hypothetical protein